jgi:hypothetical protein
VTSAAITLLEPPFALEANARQTRVTVPEVLDGTLDVAVGTAARDLFVSGGRRAAGRLTLRIHGAEPVLRVHLLDLEEADELLIIDGADGRPGLTELHAPKLHRVDVLMAHTRATWLDLPALRRASHLHVSGCLNLTTLTLSALDDCPYVILQSAPKLTTVDIPAGRGNVHVSYGLGESRGRGLVSKASLTDERLSFAVVTWTTVKDRARRQTRGWDAGGRGILAFLQGDDWRSMAFHLAEQAARIDDDELVSWSTKSTDPRGAYLYDRTFFPAELEQPDLRCELGPYDVDVGGGGGWGGGALWRKMRAGAWQRPPPKVVAHYLEITVAATGEVYRADNSVLTIPGRGTEYVRCHPIHDGYWEALTDGVCRVLDEEAEPIRSYHVLRFGQRYGFQTSGIEFVVTAIRDARHPDLVRCTVDGKRVDG